MVCFYALNELLRIQDNYRCHLSLLKMFARKINVKISDGRVCCKRF